MNFLHRYDISTQKILLRYAKPSPCARWAYAAHAPASHLGKRCKSWQATIIRSSHQFDANRFAKSTSPPAARENIREPSTSFCGTLMNWTPASHLKLLSPHCPRQKQIFAQLSIAPRIKKGCAWPLQAMPGISTCGKSPGNPESSLTGS